MTRTDGRHWINYGWKLVIAVVSLLALGTGAFLIKRYFTDPSQVSSIQISLAVEVFVASLVAVTAYFTITQLTNVESALNLRRHVVEPVLQAIAETNSVVHVGVRSLPWPSLFGRSKNVFLIVQGWDGWKDHVGEPLKKFLQDGGQLHVLMPKTTLPSGKPHGHIQIVANRMGKTVQDQIREIENTEAELRKLASSVSGASRKDIQFHYTDKMNWFCGIYFEPHVLVISVYQHKAFRDIAHIAAPSFVIDIATYSALQRWFHSEWEELTGTSPW